ncbi:MAG: hypothetical protein Q4Q04_05010 [Methanocorpusculum sp.]|nr:hypothetical protein [Methanocorpusculum sp.]
MLCSRCRSEAVIVQPYSGLALCMRHLTADVEAKAKKEIRRQGGLSSKERIFVDGEDDFRTFALRIFLSALFVKRTDIQFTPREADATVIFSIQTLDDVSSALLRAVLSGTTVSYLERDAVRRISPLSVIPASEVFLYAEAHGWPGARPAPAVSTADAFLDAFVREHPGTRYALKNIADYLEDVS